MSSIANLSTSSISLEVSEIDNDRVSASSHINKRGSESHNLCSLCRLIDFEYVGYHDSSEYSSNSYSYRREFPALRSRCKDCVFCKRLVSIITDWLSEITGDKTNDLDVSRSLIDVSLETDWHTVTREKEERCVDEKTHSDRIRISCSIPQLYIQDEPEKSQFLTFFLQRYEEPSCQAFQNSLSDQCHRLPVDCEVQPYNGRKRPIVANLTLFRKWKQLCQDVHGTKCSQVFKETSKVRPRVIDVDRRCLVFAADDDQWTCLSYVWGKANTLRLTKDNVQTFSVPGSLKPSVVPNIIEDALQVTKGLGVRYLWVDSLCIIQDDEQDKAEFISQMDSIYTRATVVIISSTCVDANSRLPGVRLDSRNRKQEPFIIRDVTLIQSLDPVFGVNVDLRTGRAAGYLGETIWDTRAWTLQERFLASRSLVFTPEQVFWECEEAFWCEDSFREFPNISPDPHRTSLCGGELNLSWNSDIPTFDHYYRVLLEEYSGRSLSFDSDGLNAFHGIVRAFERSIDEEFFWGMPTAFLESALAWGHQSHKLRRRRGGQKSGNNQFPSWSWVGWAGDGQTKLTNQNLTTEALGLKFYRVLENGVTLTELNQAAKFNQNADLLVEGSNLPDRSSRPFEVSIQDLAADGSISLTSTLCFWTVSTRLDLTSRSSSENLMSADIDTLASELALSQGSKGPIQVSWSHITPSLKQGDKVEVIAVAQNRGIWDYGHIANGAIGIMVISWDASGVTASREGFAWMAIREWTALSDRTWKLIILG